jgi:predicted transcriptional regulator
VLTTFNVLLRAHTGVEDIIVGVPAAKRDCVKTMLREPNVQTIAEKLRNTARRIANDSQAIDPKLKTHPH